MQVSDGGDRDRVGVGLGPRGEAPVGGEEKAIFQRQEAWHLRGWTQDFLVPVFARAGDISELVSLPSARPWVLSPAP